MSLVAKKGFRTVGIFRVWGSGSGPASTNLCKNGFSGFKVQGFDWTRDSVRIGLEGVGLRVVLGALALGFWSQDLETLYSVVDPVFASLFRPDPTRARMFRWNCGT